MSAERIAIPASFGPDDFFDYPCEGGCGFFLSRPHATCGSCQVRLTMRSAHDEQERSERERLIVTERRMGPVVVRTCGFGIYVETLAPQHHPFGQPLYRSTAEWLAETLLDRVKFVDGLESPYRAKAPFHGTFREILKHHPGPPLIEAFSFHHAALESWEAEGGTCLDEPPALLPGWPENRS
jgi:hypothetical protein